MQQKNKIPASAVAVKKLKIWNTAGALKSKASVTTVLISAAAKKLSAITTKAIWNGSTLIYLLILFQFIVYSLSSIYSLIIDINNIFL